MATGSGAATTDIEKDVHDSSKKVGVSAVETPSWKVHRLIVDHPYLSSSQKGVMHALAVACDWRTWSAIVSNAWLAHAAGVSARTVQRAMLGHGKQAGLESGFGIVSRLHNRKDGLEHASTFFINVDALQSGREAAVRGAALGVDHSVPLIDVLRESAKVSIASRVSEKAWIDQPELADLWVEDQLPDGLRVP